MPITDLDRLHLFSKVLEGAEVEHTLENTSGGIHVLYVPLTNDHHLEISVNGASLPWTRLDQLVFMIFCYNSSDADDKGMTMIDDASTPLALACVLQALGRTFFTIQ